MMKMNSENSKRYYACDAEMIKLHLHTIELHIIIRLLFCTLVSF